MWWEINVVTKSTKTATVREYEGTTTLLQGIHSHAYRTESEMSSLFICLFHVQFISHVLRVFYTLS